MEVQQCAMILGKAVTFAIEWESLTGGVEGMGMLLNAGLTPVIGGLAILLADAKRKEQAQGAISRVVLRQASGASEHGFTLKGGTLTYAVVLSPAMPTMEPQLAATLLGRVLDSQGLARRVGAKMRKGAAGAKKKGKAACRRRKGAKKSRRGRSDARLKPIAPRRRRRRALMEVWELFTGTSETHFKSGWERWNGWFCSRSPSTEHAGPRAWHRAHR